MHSCFFFFLKKKTTQDHVASFPFVLLVVSLKTVDLKHLLGDPVCVVFALHLLYDDHSHVLIFMPLFSSVTRVHARS